MGSIRRVLAFCLLNLTLHLSALGEDSQANFPDALRLPGENYLMTNNPTSFGGMHVNDFLGADRFYQAGILGAGALAANVEAGHVWGGQGGHTTLDHVNTYVTGSGAAGETDWHATAVAMMIGGRNGGANPGDWQTGIAPGAELASGAIATSWTSTTGFNATANSILSTYQAFFGVADVINSSWGFTDTTGTHSLTVSLDGLARENPTTTFVAAVGNGGPGSNSVRGPASGYNSISVGALANANLYDTVASFSSRGPQDVDLVPGGQRAAVDIVAPGQALTTAHYGGATGGYGWPGAPQPVPGDTDSYTHGRQGTSYAAPIVAGAAALLVSASEAYDLDATSRTSHVIKSVLLNSAAKTPGWNNGQADVDGVLHTTQSLDWATGAGRLNLTRAFDQYLGGTTDVELLGGGSLGVAGWDLGRIQSGHVNDYAFEAELSAGSTMTVTLTWHRDRSSAGNDRGLADLNLEVWDEAFTTPIAKSASYFNAVEHLHFALPADGRYGLRIVCQDGVLPGAKDEYYGLAWWAPTAGDVNLDGAVNTADVSLLMAHWGSGNLWTQGDFDQDGTVGSADLSLLVSRWGFGSSAGSAAASFDSFDASQAPAPSCAVLLLGGGGFGWLVRRRRGRRPPGRC